MNWSTWRYRSVLMFGQSDAARASSGIGTQKNDRRYTRDTKNRFKKAWGTNNRHKERDSEEQKTMETRTK